MSKKIEISKEVLKEIIQFYITENHSKVETTKKFNISSTKLKSVLAENNIKKTTKHSKNPKKKPEGRYENKLVCLECGKDDVINLYQHLKCLHHMTKEEYTKKYNYNGNFAATPDKALKEKMGKKKDDYIVWNKGLTKETDSRIKSTAGRKMTEEQKALISKRTKEAMQRPEVKEKLGKVALNFHMYDRPEVRQKMRNTMTEKYGNKINYWGNNSEKYEKFKDILFSKEDFIKAIEKCEESLGYAPSSLDLAEFIKCTPTVIYSKIKEYKLENKINFKTSRLENIFKDWINSLNIKYIKHDRKVIYPKEIDFYFPEYNLGIEINDIYSHNSTFASYRSSTPTSSQYHQEKVLLAEKNNIHLIHLYEWEILNVERFNKIKSYLLSIFKPTIKIYARKCDCKEVDKSDTRKFYRENHLQGTVNNLDINIGLYYNNELISCMSFGKPRFDNKYEYELLRFANKSGYSIVGAASRLFKHFLLDNFPESIISYCDLDKFNGGVYEALGFKFIKYTSPTYNWTNYKEIINWKVILDKGPDKILGTNYGKGTNNEEIMIKEGFVKVYNSGNKVYVYENK